MIKSNENETNKSQEEFSRIITLLDIDMSYDSSSLIPCMISETCKISPSKLQRQWSISLSTHKDRRTRETHNLSNRSSILLPAWPQWTRWNHQITATAQRARHLRWIDHWVSSQCNLSDKSSNSHADQTEVSNQSSSKIAFIMINSLIALLQMFANIEVLGINFESSNLLFNLILYTMQKIVRSHYKNRLFHKLLIIAHHWPSHLRRRNWEYSESYSILDCSIESRQNN